MPWTRSAVESALIAAFRAMPDCPVYSAGGRAAGGTTRLHTADMHYRDQRNAMTDVLNWVAFIADDRQARIQLLTWARCRATGASFAAICRDLGWTQITAERGRRRGAIAIAARLNELS